MSKTDLSPKNLPKNFPQISSKKSLKKLLPEITHKSCPKFHQKIKIKVEKIIQELFDLP